MAAEDATPRRTTRRRFVLGGAAALAGGTGALHGCAVAAPAYDGPVSDHFDGTRFLNPGVERLNGFGDFLRWRWNREPGAWSPVRDFRPGPPPPARVTGGALRVTFVNHATALVQIDGLNLLTDPVWSDSVGPFSFVGPGRHHPPGLRFEDLPAIDAVLLSHNHYDHCDLPTLRRIAERDGARVVTPLGNAALLERGKAGRAIERDWWGSTRLSETVTVTVVPAQHWSGRGLTDRARNLWGGFFVQGRRRSLYFAGDTGYGAHFAAIRRRLGSPTVALLPIGAYEPRWFMKTMHIDPAEAVRAQLVLGARVAVPVHHGTFELSDEGRTEPLADLATARAAIGLDRERFEHLPPGRAVAV